jgi:hypothetical protein
MQEEAFNEVVSLTLAITPAEVKGLVASLPEGTGLTVWKWRFMRGAAELLALVGTRDVSQAGQPGPACVSRNRVPMLNVRTYPLGMSNRQEKTQIPPRR